MIELAIAVVLLAGAGLLGKSLYRLLHVPLGFDPNQVATVRVIAPDQISKGGKSQDGGIFARDGAASEEPTRC